MKRFLIGTLKLLGLFLIMVVIAGLIPKVGIVVSTVIMLAGAIAVIKPLPHIGLGHRGFAFTMALAIGAFGLLMSFGVLEQEKHRGQTEQRLAELRMSDQDAYLNELKAYDEDRWLRELELLRPKVFQAEMDRRARLAAEAAAAEAARAKAERLEREAEAERQRLAEEAEHRRQEQEAEAARRKEAETARAEAERLKKEAEAERQRLAEEAERSKEAKAAARAAESARAEEERLARLAEEEERAQAEQKAKAAAVTAVLEAIQRGEWFEAHRGLGRLGDDDIETAYDQFEAAALAVVRPLPASDLFGNKRGYDFLLRLRPENPQYRRKAEYYAARIKDAKQNEKRSAPSPRWDSESEAQTLAKVSGALVGMATACGYKPSEEWVRSVVRKRHAIAVDDADFAASTKTFETYGSRAFFMQSADPEMSCGQVIKMMRDSERNMR